MWSEERVALGQGHPPCLGALSPEGSTRGRWLLRPSLTQCSLQTAEQALAMSEG